MYLTTEYENYKDHTAIDESSVYFRDLKEYDEAADFEITSGTDTLAQKNTSGLTANILTAVLIIGSIVGGIVWWSKKQ